MFIIDYILWLVTLIVLFNFPPHSCLTEMKETTSWMCQSSSHTMFEKLLKRKETWRGSFS